MDNVQFTAHARADKADRSAQFHIMTLSFAAKHRVKPPTDLGVDCVSAIELDPDVFLPTPEDFDHLMTHMTYVIKRILVSTLSFASHLKPPRMTHDHTKEMDTKSEIVNLGVLEGNPSKTPSTIDILDQFMAYVPVVDNVAMSVPVHGDAATIDTIIKAKTGRCLSRNENRNFKSLLEVGQEFHKEGVLLDVSLMSHIMIQ